MFSFKVIFLLLFHLLGWHKLVSLLWAVFFSNNDVVELISKTTKSLIILVPEGFSRGEEGSSLGTYEWYKKEGVIDSGSDSGGYFSERGLLKILSSHSRE